MQSQRVIHHVWHAEGSEFCLNKILINMRDEEARYPHKVAMVMGGECEQFFPMSLIKKRKQIKKNVRNSRGTITLKKINIDTVFGVVDTSGYVRLANLDRKFCVQEALGLIEDVVMLMKRAEDYLLFPEDYILTTNNVYLKHREDHEPRKVKVAFIPANRERGRTGGWNETFGYFIHELRKLCSPDGQFYINRLSEEVYSKDRKYRGMGYAGLINLINKLKAEAYANGVR